MLQSVSRFETRGEELRQSGIDREYFLRFKLLIILTFLDTIFNFFYVFRHNIY
jgi:hypothetical protein